MSLLTSSNEAYHADRTALSSSALKLLLKDPGQFYTEYMLNQKPEQAYKAAFEDGTLTHALILEPETVANYAVFPGLRKHGKAWEDFKEANAGKICISAAQMLRAEKLYKAHASMEVATKLVSNGLPEHTMVGTVLDQAVKARADYIVPKQYIVDVKTTSLPSDRDLFAETVTQYGYHLSAALYRRIAEQTYGVPHDFYWEVLSKEDGQCHVYKASEQTLAAGDVLVQRAILLYKKCVASGVWSTEQPETDRSTVNYEVELI